MDVRLLGALYLAELSVLLIALLIHKKGGRSFGSWMLTPPGLALLGVSLAALIAFAFIGRQYLRHRGSRTFALVVAMNLITLGLILIPAEIALRFAARHTADARTLGDRTLFPRSWERAAAQNLQIVSKASGDLSYLVYDDTLGWTVGRSRRNANGMYLSSAEGLRAAQQGAAVTALPGRRQIALVGDSFVFAEQVQFEDSWGHLIESRSAGELQVLNFGVGGYGVDQAYLRFKKDVLPWKPEAVVLGFPMADLLRTMTVYPFIEWPQWEMPFSKPRLIREGAALRALNLPTLAPREMFGRPSIGELPFLEFEVGYRAHEWEHGIADASLLKRWLFAAFPRWIEKNKHVNDEEMIQLNGAILREFIRLAEENRVTPIIAYFPGKPEILRIKRGESTDGQRIMKRMDVPFVDTTPCVMELDPDAAYVPNDPHYSPRGNAAVAKCIAAALDRTLAVRRDRRAASNDTGPAPLRKEFNGLR